MGKKNDYTPFGGMEGQPLTPQQIIILDMYFKDEVLEDIGEKVGYTASTVQTQLQYIRWKFGCNTIVGAIRKALKQKIIHLD